jgi:hypothetical protein
VEDGGQVLVSCADLDGFDPAPLPLEPPLDPRAEPFVAVIKAAGAEPMIEWGVLSGEILGLKVAALHDPDGA